MDLRAPRAPTGLAPGELRRSCDPAGLGIRTTADLAELEDGFGQERAVSAIEFGTGMRSEGYNLFAMGPAGAGRHTLVARHLRSRAASLEAPPDWCYVFNFDTPHQPRALRFPAGKAAAFKAALDRLVEDLRSAIPAVFESNEYRNRRRQIEAELAGRQERAVEQIGERARAQGIALVHTPSGFGFGPMGKETVMSPEEFRALPADQQKRYEELVSRFQEEMALLLQEMPKWRRETLDRVRKLNREVVGTAIGALIGELQLEYRALPQVHEHLLKLEQDMLDHAEVFRGSKEGEPPTFLGLPLPQPDADESPLRRYAVNLLIGHPAASGGPVIYEDNPNHDALVGRIEHVSRMGTLVTDFTLIKAGALHRANGGYLVLDALKVLGEPYAWEALKRALRSREIRTQSLGQALGLFSTISLEPQPIPLDVKVVLVGERRLYYLLHAYDPEFAALFKVVADFEDEVARGVDGDLRYARVIATLARKEGLRPLDAGAVASVIDRQCREAGDAAKLSASMQSLVDLLRECDYWARSAGRELIEAQDVRSAVEAQVRRRDRVRQRLLDEVLEGARLIDTSGERVGQVNGLAVVQLGDFAFGTPHRITARARLGGGGVVDIERESGLGGPLHSKGVLILAGFLSGRYAANKPLSLSASLVFEQSYAGVEGDSASSGELYALLSALADAPLRQSLAVTGSVNQHGDVQAIGGVNEKIEGFFDLCRSRGLDAAGGTPGVLIPAANVRNLMLREDVIEAVRQGRFAVHAVGTVDEGMALLTGLTAATINARVEARLADLAERARSFVGAAARKPWQRKPGRK